jgi:hypothetical protein
MTFGGVLSLVGFCIASLGFQWKSNFMALLWHVEDRPERAVRYAAK